MLSATQNVRLKVDSMHRYRRQVRSRPQETQILLVWICVFTVTFDRCVHTGRTCLSVTNVPPDFSDHHSIPPILGGHPVTDSRDTDPKHHCDRIYTSG